MKKNKFSIWGSWILLFCFAVGQCIVYVHQHKFFQNTQGEYSISKNRQKPATSIQEKCYLCDAMHHSAITISNTVFFSPLVVTKHIYKVGDYNFISISLVLAAGRAPPVIC